MDGRRTKTIRLCLASAIIISLSVLSLCARRNVVYNLSIFDLTEQQKLIWYSPDDDVKMCVVKGKDEVSSMMTTTAIGGWYGCRIIYIIAEHCGRHVAILCIADNLSNTHTNIKSIQMCESTLSIWGFRHTHTHAYTLSDGVRRPLMFTFPVTLIRSINWTFDFAPPPSVVRRYYTPTHTHNLDS